MLKEVVYWFMYKLSYGRTRKYYKERYKNIKNKNINMLTAKVVALENFVKNLEYEICDKYNLSTKNELIPRIMSINETLDIVINEKRSISRFGDGEFRVILGGDDNLKKFYFGTDFDLELQKRLIDVLRSNEQNHLVCLWDNFGNLDKYTDHGKYIARMYMPLFREELSKYLIYDKIYGNLNITRPYLIYKDKSNCSFIFNKIKKIWDNKEIVIIEGIYSKLGVGNDLFNSAKKVERILCPAENAWYYYEDILKAAIKIPKNKLILIALGMTATVLAYDLSRIGYWAIDIGHIDIEYEWYLKGVESPVVVNGKYTNDAMCGGGIGNTTIPTNKLDFYKEQILEIVRGN